MSKMGIGMRIFSLLSGIFFTGLAIWLYKYIEPLGEQQATDSTQWAIAFIIGSGAVGAMFFFFAITGYKMRNRNR